MTHTDIMSEILLLVAAILVSLNMTGQASHIQTHETITRHSDGNNIISEKTFVELDSNNQSAKPRVVHEKTITNSIGDNKIDSKEQLWPAKIKPFRIKLRKSSKKKHHKHNLIFDEGDHVNDFSLLNSIGGHQAFGVMRPRTVESPALSVDTGRGRSSSPSVRLANGLKRLFHVEEGHYTDIYDRIDKHKPLKKRRPAESVDERLSYSHNQ